MCSRTFQTDSGDFVTESDIDVCIAKTPVCIPVEAHRTPAGMRRSRKIVIYKIYTIYRVTLPARPRGGLMGPLRGGEKGGGGRGAGALMHTSNLIWLA